MRDGMKVIVVMDWVSWLLVDKMKAVVLMGKSRLTACRLDEG